MDNFPDTITIPENQEIPKTEPFVIVKKTIKKRGRPKVIVKSDIKIIQGPVTVDFS